MKYQIEDDFGNTLPYTREEIMYLVKGDRIYKGTDYYYAVDFKELDLDNYVTTLHVKRIDYSDF